MAQDRVEAVERALTALEAFDTDREALTLAELAQATGFYKSTLLRLLGSLERFDYVQRSADGRWRLGASPGRLARRHAPGRHLAARVQPWLDRLAAETGETAALLEIRGDQVECRLAALPASELRHELRPGRRWPLADPADPRPPLPGGAMVCLPLEDAADASLWLSLSGPAGRLSTARAHQALSRARDGLAAPRTTEATP
ncbi:helix-turn-helix domain-containing protein [Halomonas koreensis]|uniref:Helix-turn-helix domain-containing protein n=1 Tax=Halomonas koreensis TaxID=245385 RepID=A0ABU1G334_9GAMM|nr:helix-turn-helix domain-containing protein [Halomonas koreensis]MDR5866973.1 helix-turn-helix domain-containing protein [Halomonas koreensis]